MKETIIKMLKEICDTPNVDFETDELLYSGILNSLGLMTLISELSDEFEIEIDVDDLEFEDFSTVNSIVALIERIKE